MLMEEQKGHYPWPLMVLPKYFHNQGSKDQHIYNIPKETLTLSPGNILKTLNRWS